MACYATFWGNVGADAEVRAAGERTVCGFSVAVTCGFGKKKKTEWYDVSVWGKRGDSLAPYLTKGKPVMITGEITHDEFQRRDGSAGLAIRVDASAVEFLPSARNTEPPAELTAKKEEIPF